MTLSIKSLLVTPSTTNTHLKNTIKRRYAVCSVLFIVVLNVIMQSVALMRRYIQHNGIQQYDTQHNRLNSDTKRKVNQHNYTQQQDKA